MKRYARLLQALPTAVAGFGLAAAAPANGAAPAGGATIPFDEADIFLELNDTDGDLGIHALIDGDEWKTLDIERPGESEILTINVKGTLRRHGLTEIFFESAEPTFDDVPPPQFFHRFPEGTYEIGGVTLDGVELESAVELSHVLPAPAEIVDPMPTGCDEPFPVSSPVTIDWNAVTSSHPDIGRDDPDIVITGYQVVVEREEPRLLVLSVDLPAAVTAFTVPEQFLAFGEEFKFEVIAREESGNKTAVESCFLLK